MKSFCLSLLLLLAVIAPGLPAQAQKATPRTGLPQQKNTLPTVSKAVRGRVKITHGKYQSVVDLEKDISGCFDLYESYPPKRFVRASAGIKVIDRVSKDAKYYLVLLAEATSNCHVQGHSGAGIDYTLIWLKLDDRLKLEDKRAAVIANCQSNIDVIEPESAESDDGPTIKLADGKLNLKYGDLSDDAADRSRLIYDRKTPEKGFLITTEKAKSRQP